MFELKIESYSIEIIEKGIKKYHKNKQTNIQVYYQASYQ